jgi:hypothetical protein
LASRSRFTLRLPLVRWTNQFRFTGARPATAFSALTICWSIPRRRRQGPDRPVLVEDRPLHHPRLGKDLPVTDRLVGVLPCDVITESALRSCGLHEPDRIAARLVPITAVVSAAALQIP